MKNIPQHSFSLQLGQILSQSHLTNQIPTYNNFEVIGMISGDSVCDSTGVYHICGNQQLC